MFHVLCQFYMSLYNLICFYKNLANEPIELKLAAPGEIREEYQKQLSVQKEIYRLEREKEDKLSQELLK